MTVKCVSVLLKYLLERLRTRRNLWGSIGTVDDSARI
jgi:hypothetical protein